jgi:hypothetical protein
VLRPFVEQYLPEDRLIDRVRVRADSPTEEKLHAVDRFDLGALLHPLVVCAASRGSMAATSAGHAATIAFNRCAVVKQEPVGSSRSTLKRPAIMIRTR